ncbi:MAG TPA: 1,4-alpha-glucan branching protein GlgB [Streptosporangiaceae bacterium]|nr:1,4-alpha-glucan branching protein GlgB [Streptosporangiaceae bacterium]
MNDSPAGVSPGEIDRIVAGTHHDPHAILGAHRVAGGIAVRTLRPLATAVTVLLADGRRFPASHLHLGVFAATLPLTDIPDYRLAVTYPGAGDGSAADQGSGAGSGAAAGAGTAARAGEMLVDDPFRYLPTLGEVDLHLIGEGRHEELWRVLGAHVRCYPGDAPAPQPKAAARPVRAGGDHPFRNDFDLVTGTSFAVWAPNARGVRVIGDFNFWDGHAHPMRSLGGSGVWEIFVPGVGEGTRYKFEICGPDGSWQRKADPMAALAQPPPDTASVVCQSGYQWGDDDWLAARAGRDPLRQPMSVYEVHLGSWRPGLSYAELADQLTHYVTELGFTHVEFLPVAEHPFGGSWGYQVTSYYAPSARFGTPDEFRLLVDRLHQAGIGVLLDWVPAHFPRDAWALARFDGTALYENADPQRGEHPDWGTLIFDYGRPEVRNFLVANALYWLEEFHADGLRVDAVASMLYLDYSRKAGEWTPNALGGRENLDAVALLREVNATCYRRVPGIMMIAEESTAWPGVTQPVHLGGLGFGLKWNLGWMHDTLAYLAHDPVFRHYHHNELTFSMMYAYTENFVLPLSHDEVVHGKGSLLGKMPGDEWRRFAGLRALLAYMWAHPGKQLLFMGSEFGQAAEWSQQAGLDWAALGGSLHAGLQRLAIDLNAAYRGSPALWADDFSPDGFGWIDANDSAGNVVSFLRFTGCAAGGAAGGARVLACVANFAGEPHLDYRIGLPSAGRWREVINTDAAAYGGSGVGNLGVIEAVAEPWHGRPASAVLAVPPLGVLWLAPEPG